MRNDRIIDGIIKAGSCRVTWRRIMALLCVITVLMTTNQLMFKADTLERIPACGYAEHVHDESCFDGDGMPVCGLEEHTHTDACYQQRPHKAADEIQVALESPVEEVEMQLGEAVETGEVTETGEVEAGEDSGLTIEYEEPAPTEIIAADEESADEMSEELFVVTEAGDAIAGQRNVALDFTGYIATDAHTIYFYDADRAAVLVMLDELAEADGVAMTATEGTLSAEAMMGLAEIEAALEAAPEDIDALMSEAPVLYENGVLIITGDGEVAVEDTLYTVTGLTLPARAVRAQDAAGEITVSTADGQATLLDVTPAFTETANDTEVYADVFDRIAGLLPENTVTESPEEIETVVAEAGDFQLTDEEAAPQRRLMAAAPAAETLPRERMSRVLNMRLFDIALIGADGATEPGAPIHVETTFNAPISGEDFALYHIVDGEPVRVEDAVVVDEDNRAIGLSFDTSSLSPFAVAYYTVDFHWSVDGNHYDISIPGGGFIRLSELVRVLNVIPEEEDIAEFLAEVANVEFSDPELVRVVKVEETAAFGAIKEALGLESAYSVELTDEEIAAINAETVEAGDWALVSLRPFNTEETLTVTMQNGEAFTIYVTDAQTRVDVAGKHGVTNAENVGVYSGHNLVINSQIDTIETIGTRVTLLGMESGSLSLSSWYQISYLKNGETATGYVETKYIDILEMAEPVTVDNDAFGVTASWEEGVLPDGTVLEAGEPSLTEEEMEALENQALSALPTIPGKTLKVTGIHFFDLSFMADGVEIEPNGEVNVSMQLKQAIAMEDNESLHLVHFTRGTAELLENAVFTKDGSENLTGLDFTVGSFSTFAIVKTIETTFVASNGETYEITVYYPEEANIPEGSTLRVIEFTETDVAYEYARNAVLADKKARGEWVDLSSFGLAALDISIIAPNDEEIEPAVPVQVEMTIKSLPGVDDLSEVADTLAIQHHVEVEDGVVVETVYNGNTEASFRMETNETVIASGITVNPNSITEEDFAFPETFTPNSGEGEDDDIDVSFQTPVFSTFTVTWGTAGTSSQSRVSNLSNGKYIIYAKDASNNNYYALVPDTELNSVQVTLSNNIVQYSGKNDLYWDVEVSGDKYYFSFTKNGTKYYLAAGTTGNHVAVGTSKTAYGNANTTSWEQWSNYIHSAQDTFLQSYDGLFRTWNVSGQSNWGNRSLIYFERDNSVPQATIHYVDEDGTELPVSNGSISSSTLLNNYAYLIYDIEGGEYEYKETYIRRNSADTKIRAYLYRNSTNWWYTTDGNNWSNVNDNDDIYVVYKEKKRPTEGGTPTLVELDDDEKPEEPTVTKDSKVNGDGTNTLSLSVTSHTKPREVLKLADVIVIFDRSGSMKQNINNSENADKTADRRMTLLQNAVNSLADDLIGDNSVYIYTDKEGVKHKQIEMSLVSFSTTATEATSFTDKASTFKGWVNALNPDGGTNWEQALQKANEAAVDSGRATFVIFVTDGEPTFRMSRMTDEDNSLDDDMFSNGPTYYSSNSVYGTGSSDNKKDGTEAGRNYRAALAQAQAIVAKNKNLYMIGVGPEVGNLEQFNTDAGADGYYPATSSEALTSAFEDIKKRIAALAGYSDFQISDGITDLTQTVQKSTLVDFADDDFTYYKGVVDHYDYVYATQEDVEKGLATNVGDVIKKTPVVTTWQTWDPASENCNPAEYKNGAVVWNMGESFMPQEDYTYQVRFKVWPSQAAYDLLADLNNGKKSYDSLTEAEKAQIKEPTTADGMYTLKTNSETSYNFKDATIVDGKVTPNGNDLLVPAGTFDDVDPLELTTKPLKVKKQWHKNYVDSRVLADSITMELYAVDLTGNLTQEDTFRTITLKPEYQMVEGHYVDKEGNALFYNEETKKYVYEDGTVGTPLETDKSWYDDKSFVSYGLVTYNTTTNKGAKVYETGHDFTLRETDDEAHYYELTAGVYRPMFINGTATILEKVDAAPDGMSSDVFHYSDGTDHYYRLDGKIYRNTQSDVLLIATNSHRSYMDLVKEVVDEEQPDKTVVDNTAFEYRITFTVPAGIANYDSEKYIWFSVYDSVAKRTLAPEEFICTGAQKPADVDSSTYGGSQYANYLVATSGQQFTLKIKQGWNVRFLNLPIGTTYSFEEINIPDGYSFVKAEVTGTQWIANMVDGVDEGKAVTMTGLPVNDGKGESKVITGTIGEANARYKTTYTNKAKSQQVYIKKTGQDGTVPLAGAEFKLYTEEGYNADPKKEIEYEGGLKSGADGKINLGKLSVGKYYLEETKAPLGYIGLTEPVVITVTAKDVTYNLNDSGISLSHDGITTGEDGSYTLTVTNSAGYELPSTGGPGTLAYTLTGALLILGAALLLLRRRAE